MRNKFEKKILTPAEARKNFKNSLIQHILELSVPKIVANTKGRDVEERDLAEVMGDNMRQYKESDMTRKILGIKNYKEWDSFFDEVVDTVLNKVREEKQKNSSGNTGPLRSQNLKQKDLF